MTCGSLAGDCRALLVGAAVDFSLTIEPMDGPFCAMTPMQRWSISPLGEMKSLA
jgi:hypothetical protein